MKRIGLIVNPVAGIGGRVGLKGSDGKETQRRAFELGAEPESRHKAEAALKTMLALMGDEGVEIVTWRGEMGENVSEKFPFEYSVVGGAKGTETTADDTIEAARAMKRAGADVILFAGGDGTARNILDAIGVDIPVIGIPAGCKIHSAVYAVNPKSAGELVAQYVKGEVKELRESEVMDIDEELFRENRVEARLYGYLKVPAASRMQNLKSGRGYSESASIALLSRYVADCLEENALYIIGGGSTTKSIMDVISLPDTLLGVDLFRNRKIIKNDVTERDILDALDRYPYAKIIVTVIGGQGYLFGRGNQQISAEVIRRVGKENIIITASKDKMYSLFGQELLVDTGDEDTNEYLAGYYKVVVGSEEYVMFPVTA
jgi:predicted polyphosphate/ATP-dependent NAD kinase